MISHLVCFTVEVYWVLTHLQAARVFSAMLDELTMDATLKGHLEVAKSRAVCHVCHTR